MKIAIYNLEPKYINIALEKIKMYHIQQGHKVENYLAGVFHTTYDKIYCSSIFDFTSKTHVTDDMDCGGTGFEYLLSKKLPEEMDKLNPKLNIGFTTRGCIRNCEWCVVPKKEGKIKVVADIYDIWDGKSKEIILLDNNILALSNHFKKICAQLREEKLKVDFNQGLDIKLLTEDLCKELKSIKTKEYRFAFDFPELKKVVIEKCKLLNKYKISALWYVLVGFNSDFEEELARINILYDCNQRVYVMKHKNCKKDKRYTGLSNWANSICGFRAMTFWEYLECDRGKGYKKLFHWRSN